MTVRAGRLVGLAARAYLPFLLAVLLTLSVAPSASAGSNTWTQLTVAGKQVGGLAVAPSDPNILLARTPQGLLRSTDHGRTWKLAGRRLGTHYESYFGLYGPGGKGDTWGWSVWIDPLDPRIVYSAVEESDFGFWGGFTPTAIYRSADGGGTWKRVLADDGGTVAIYPADPRIVYLAGTYGIWKSVDRGLTWSRVYYLGARELAISPTDPDLVLAVAGDYVVQSANGGKSWDSAGVSDIQILPDAGSSAVMVPGAEVAYWSADGGSTWDIGDRGWLNPLDPSERFTVASDKEGDTPGIVRSADWGRSKSLLPLPPTTNTWIQGLVIDRGSPQTLYALTGDGRLWSYTFGAAAPGVDALPKTGSPDEGALSVAAVLALALSLTGLRLRRGGRARSLHP